MRAISRCSSLARRGLGWRDIGGSIVSLGSLEEEDCHGAHKEGPLQQQLARPSDGEAERPNVQHPRLAAKKSIVVIQTNELRASEVPLQP